VMILNLNINRAVKTAKNNIYKNKTRIYLKLCKYEKQIHLAEKRDQRPPFMNTALKFSLQQEAGHFLS
jgi:predicted DNA-binding protein YlxM (UPF0122 family)